MELMLAGDFLSPTMIGVIGADFLNMRQYGDRAATLEKAWERRFETVTGKDTLSEPMVSLRNRVLADDCSATIKVRARVNQDETAPLLP